MFVLRFILCALPQRFVAYGNAGTQSKTFTFVLAVVFDVAMGEGGRLKAVFAFVFCALARRDDAAFEVGVVSDLDLIAVFSGGNTALCADASVFGVDFALAVTAAGTESVAYGHLGTGVLLFALIGFAILYTFYMQVTRICLYAFADKLRTFEGGIPAASDNRFAGHAANMGGRRGAFV